MRIGFHFYFLGLRGTELATIRFASYNKSILGNESLLFLPENITENCHPGLLNALKTDFEIRYYPLESNSKPNMARLERLTEEAQLDAYYCHEVWADADWALSSCRTLIHAAFPWCRPRGDVFVATSNYLGRHFGSPTVPIIMEANDYKEDMRSELNIPPSATVFGRHGGLDTFDIPWVHECVLRTVQNRPDSYFLFMNTQAFCEAHPRIIHIVGSDKEERKASFINTCNAMLHARNEGETFGMAVAEFAMRCKPVITWAHGADSAHLEELQGDAIVYSNEFDLDCILTHFKSPLKKGSSNRYANYTANSVMTRFKNVFLTQE